MIQVMAKAKETFEKRFDCLIYRHTLPHGVDCFKDIDKRFGRGFCKVIFDVGANIGQSTIKYLQKFPDAEIYSFEPVAGNYRQLVEATSGSAHVHTYQVGMGPKAGSAEIYLNQFSTTCSIKHSDPGAQTETIALETLAGFTGKENLEKIDFLKLDTEGYELDVLAGAIPLLEQQRIHLIYVECEPVSSERRFISLEELGGFLKGFGYRPFGLYEQQTEWNGANALRYINAVFVCDKLILPHARVD